MRTVVFDLDGTLADTSGDLLAAANACFVGQGLGALLDQRDALTAFHGGRAMLRLGLSRQPKPWAEADVEALFSRFVENYADAIDIHTRLYPGAVPAVEALLAAGFKTAICTNKPEGLAETLLQRLGIRSLFGSLVGADTLPHRKPDPAPYREAVRRAGGQVSRSFLLGDTETDANCARAAGVPVVLVGFGPEGQSVQRLNPVALLNHFDDLPALAKKLLL